MRPRTFRSAVLIYGVMWLFMASTVFIAFMFVATPRVRLADVLLIIAMNIPGGIVMGFLLGAIHKPVTRTLTFHNLDQFRSAFEEALGSLGFFLHDQAQPEIVYRSISMRPPLPDVRAEFGPESAVVSGSRHILGRLERRLKDKQVLAG